MIARVLSGEVMPAMSFGPGVLSNDVFGSFFATAFLIVSIMVTVSSWNYMKGKTNPARLLFTNSFVYHRHGADCILYGPSHVACILGIDVSPNLCTRAFSKRDPISNEAAIKYFMFGALSSAILVVAIGLVYGITGTTNIAQSIQAMAHLQKDLLPVGLLAVGLFIAGFGFKMGLVPFHMWLPDAYEGSPTTIGALLGVERRKRDLLPNPGHCAGNVCPKSRLDFGISLSYAVFTMTLGNLGALVQKSVPRILAYSSIAQAGYILIGLALAPYSDQALTGSLFQIFNHAVMKSAGFIAAGGSCYRFG